jgi:hypothetical protein
MWEICTADVAVGKLDRSINTDALGRGRHARSHCTLFRARDRQPTPEFGQVFVSGETFGRRRLLSGRPRPSMSASHQDILLQLIRDYQSFNSPEIEYRNVSPSAVEFSRFVRSNRSVVFRSMAVFVAV